MITRRMVGVSATGAANGVMEAGRARRGLRDRIKRLRLDSLLAVQSGVAAGLSWWAAHDLLQHARPFFAPISAVVVLSAAVGQRWRRAVELVFGVALGIAIGDALIYVIGVGVVQIMAVVTLAILTTVLLGGGSVAMGQAAASAVLVATLAPPGTALYLDRFVDSLIGGAVGLLVLTLLLPFNPLTRVQHAAGAAMAHLAEGLALAADALADHDPAEAARALNLLRAIEADHNNLLDSLALGRETATLAPLRWRKKPALTRYVDAAVHVDRTTRNARVMARRCQAALDDGEPIPAALSRAVRLLADAVAALRQDLARDVPPVRTRELAIDAVHAGAEAYQEGVGFSGSVVVAQVRSAVIDLLRATGLSESRAYAMIGRTIRANPGEQAEEDGHG